MYTQQIPSCKILQYPSGILQTRLAISCFKSCWILQEIVKFLVYGRKKDLFLRESCWILQESYLFSCKNENFLASMYINLAGIWIEIFLQECRKKCTKFLQECGKNVQNSCRNVAKNVQNSCRNAARNVQNSCKNIRNHNYNYIECESLGKYHTCLNYTNTTADKELIHFTKASH